MKIYHVALLPLLMLLAMPAVAIDEQPASAAKTDQAAPGEHSTSVTPKPGVNGAIDINTAGMAELEMLKGVGPKTARAIIEFRDAQGGFTSADQLLAIKGIGEKTLEKMRDQIVVQ